MKHCYRHTVQGPVGHVIPHQHSIHVMSMLTCSMTDIDECGTNYTCPEAANCSNTNGSYECVCWTGYQKVTDKNGFYCIGEWLTYM